MPSWFSRRPSAAAHGQNNQTPVAEAAAVVDSMERSQRPDNVEGELKDGSDSRLGSNAADGRKPASVLRPTAAHGAAPPSETTGHSTSFTKRFRKTFSSLKLKSLNRQSTNDTSRGAASRNPVPAEATDRREAEGPATGSGEQQQQQQQQQQQEHQQQQQEQQQQQQQQHQNQGSDPTVKKVGSRHILASVFQTGHHIHTHPQDAAGSTTTTAAGPNGTSPAAGAGPLFHVPHLHMPHLYGLRGSQHGHVAAGLSGPDNDEVMRLLHEATERAKRIIANSRTQRETLLAKARSEAEQEVVELRKSFVKEGSIEKEAADEANEHSTHDVCAAEEKKVEQMMEEAHGKKAEAVKLCVERVLQVDIAIPTDRRNTLRNIQANPPDFMRKSKAHKYPSVRNDTTYKKNASKRIHPFGVDSHTWDVDDDLLQQQGDETQRQHSALYTSILGEQNFYSDEEDGDFKIDFDAMNNEHSAVGSVTNAIRNSCSCFVPR